MTDAPQVLQHHHLKKLRLPTFRSEYDKLARQCAAENRDHLHYLQRLCELESTPFELSPEVPKKNSPLARVR